MARMTLPTASGIASWLRRLEGFEHARVTDVYRFPGGASNMTCRVSLDGADVSAVVLRLQRERGIFEPYDVLREAKVLQKLAASEVPVPRVLGTETSPEPLGAPFAMLEFVDAPHMGEAGPQADYAAFVESVVAIHRLDWRSLGLDFLGVPGSAADGIRRELAAVTARMPAFGCADDPLLREAAGTLGAAIPADGALALCQGDINVYNYLFRDRAVVAVLDWEQARISDPRSDAGQLLALSALKGAPFGPASDAGFVRAYQSVTGQELIHMEFFRARWLFELGVIYEGWVAFNGTSPWYSREDLDRLLRLALSEIS